MIMNLKNVVNIDKILNKFAKNNDFILTGVIGGTLVGSFINPVIGSILGGFLGFYVGFSHKDK